MNPRRHDDDDWKPSISSAKPKDHSGLMDELAAIPRENRMDWLASLPMERQNRFKAMLSREDVAKLNKHIEFRLREARKPDRESWLAEARAGKATSVEAMMEVLSEVEEKLRDGDAAWIRRLREGSPGGAFSRKQDDTIRSIYRRYFDQGAGAE